MVLIYNTEDYIDSYYLHLKLNFDSTHTKKIQKYTPFRMEKPMNYFQLLIDCFHSDPSLKKFQNNHQRRYYCQSESVHIAKMIHFWCICKLHPYYCIFLNNQLQLHYSLQKQHPQNFHFHHYMNWI